MRCTHSRGDIQTSVSSGGEQSSHFPKPEPRAHPHRNIAVKPRGLFSPQGQHGHREKVAGISRTWNDLRGPVRRLSVLKGPARVWLASALGHSTAAPGAAPGRVLGQAGGLAFVQAAPLVAADGGEGAGAAVHHAGVQAVGRGERLEVTSQGHGQRELVHQVRGRAGHHRSAAQVLQAQDLGKKKTCLVPGCLARPTTGAAACLSAPFPGTWGRVH